MADVDPHATQRDLVPDIPAELRAAGFDDVAEIGHGGFGVVYRCAQPMLDRTVAVKVLTADLDAGESRPIHARAACDGPPVRAPAHRADPARSVQRASGRPFIVMPYHAKDSLEALIRRHGPLNWSEALSIGVKLAGALDAAHRVGTLHRDVKPANILLTDYGEPQLTDFGIARISRGLRDGDGGDHRFAGVHRTRSARRARRRPPASDVYSLGATLFCALTGHAAYERRSGEQVVAQFLRITSQPIPDLREHGLPDDVAAVIERAMARDPTDRPASAAAFGERATRGPTPATVPPSTRWHDPVELGRRAAGEPAPCRRSTARGTLIATPTPPTPGDQVPAPVASPDRWSPATG